MESQISHLNKNTKCLFIAFSHPASVLCILYTNCLTCCKPILKRRKFKERMKRRNYDFMASTWAPNLSTYLAKAGNP